MVSNLVAAALFRCFNAGYHAGAAGRPQTPPSVDKPDDPDQRQYVIAYEAGYVRGVLDKHLGAYTQDSGPAWRRFLNQLP